MSKSHVTPVKCQVSLVCLELQAAKVACDIYITLRRELGLQAVPLYMWSDSTIVLGYIHNEIKRFHTFVANRVSYIRENTLPCSWVKVSSNDNPADMLTHPRLFSLEKQ